MTMEVKKAFHDSLQGGSSLFNMDFASDGLSWVKGICQAFEVCVNYLLINYLFIFLHSSALLFM